MAGRQTPRSITSADAEHVVAAEQVPEGWDVGQAAPNARYAPMGPDGEPDLSKLQDEPVEGYGVQVVAKGDTITQAIHDQLNA